MEEKKGPRIFISYAWEDEAYKLWIERLATTMERDGINVRYDKFCEPSQPFPSFMNSEVRQADRVLVVGSPQYRIKVHATEDQQTLSGVGWESMLLTSQLFQGSRQKVLAAIGRGTRQEALPDYLVTLPTYDLTDQDDRREYDRLISYLHGLHPKSKSSDGDVPIRPKVFPLWERQSNLRFISSLHSYISSRWPDKGNDAIYTSWREFAESKISIPHQLQKDISEILEKNHIALLIGATGTGKSVTAAALAYNWTRLSGRNAYWLDCNDFQTSIDLEIRHEAADILEAGGSNLLIIDNAQNSPNFSRWVLTQFQEHEQPRHRLLILSRPLPTHDASTEASYFTALEGSGINLETTPNLFRCVAERLVRRTDAETPNWVDTQFENWYQDFGGDVVAFAYAFLNAKDRLPNASAVTGYIRSKFIDRFRRLEKGLATLTRLSTASMLDISLDDAGLGEKGINTSEILLLDGSVSTKERAGYRYWEFGNAGLAKLIASTIARDKGVEFLGLVIDALADVVNDSPRLFSQIISRLNQRNDGSEILELLLNKLQQGNSLDFLMANQPVAALSLTRRFPSYFSWNTVLAVEKNEAAFLNTISRYSFHEVVAFVRTFRRALRTDNIPWFDKLLDTEGFRSSLDNRSPDEIAAILKLCNEMRPELVKELGVQLMASDKFKQVSKHAFPQHVGSLVVILEKELPGTSTTYLSSVIRSDEFFHKITQAQPNAVAMFLKLAENYAREDVKRILKKLIADKQFFSTLVNSQQSLTTALLEYLFTCEQDGGKILLRSLLKDPIFTSMSASARPDELGQFIAFSEKHDPKTTEQMIRVLLLRPEFSDASEQLPPLLSPITIRIALRANKQVTLSIVDKLLSAQGFQHILCSNIPVKIRRTLKALETSGEKHVRAAISVLLHSKVFEDKLSQEEPEQIAALLKFIIKYEPVATAQLTARLLGSEAFILRSTSSPQVHVASIVRFASRTSAEVVANFISSWWGHFSHRGEKLNGKTLAGCGPMLRVANEFVPSVAIEMVEWLDAQGDYFIEEMREVPREIRLGLFNALTESGKTLSETKMRALGNNG